MAIHEAKRLKQLEDENSKLKQFVAGQVSPSLHSDVTAA